MAAEALPVIPGAKGLCGRIVTVFPGNSPKTPAPLYNLITIKIQPSLHVDNESYAVILTFKNGLLSVPRRGKVVWPVASATGMAPPFPKSRRDDVPSKGPAPLLFAIIAECKVG